VRSINRKVMLLQQFLPAIHQTSSKFFVFQDSASIKFGAQSASGKQLSYL